MSNVAKKERFSVTIQSDAYRGLINSTLGDKQRAANFIASISSAVATNPTLQECNNNSIITAALVGESLNLPPSPQLGYFYMVPYNNRKTGGKDAQFQIGYRGYIQLAMRTGQYRRINVSPVKEGELVSFDPFNESVVLDPIQNDEERSKAKTMGYYAMFEMLNGFTKKMYWSAEKMEHHAITYSQGYKAKKGYTFWEKNFDEMANKTMLRQLLSKWGMLSGELQKAYQSDMAVINDDLTPHYIDNEEDYGSNVEVIDQNEGVFDTIEETNIDDI